MKLSTPAIHRAVLRAIEPAAAAVRGGDYLDVVAGAGGLLARVRDRFGVGATCACDYTESLMELPGQRVDVADLNREPLPYADGRFALVTCVETIEHLEHYRETVREVFRVLRPGGRAVFTTPNVLNLKSRLRYLTTGFANLFGPLAVREGAIHDTGGHINPVGWFYLAHALLDAGFVGPEASVDRWQRSAYVPFTLLYLPVRALAAAAWRKEGRKFKTLTPANRPLVARLNSPDLLLGRTLVVAATKPRHGPGGDVLQEPSGTAVSRS